MATVSKPTYYLVTAGLMVLLVLTVGVSFIPMGRTLGVVLAFTIAGAKALMIILYFMHIRYSSRLVMIVASAGFLWLFLLFLFTFGDYLTRAWIVW